MSLNAMRTDVLPGSDSSGNNVSDANLRCTISLVRRAGYMSEFATCISALLVGGLCGTYREAGRLK